MIRRVLPYSALQAAAQLALLGASLVLAAFVGPNGFGRYSVFLSAMVILSTVMTLRFDQVVAGATNHLEAVAMLRRFATYLGMFMVTAPLVILVLDCIELVEWRFSTLVAVSAAASAVISVCGSFVLRQGAAFSASLPRLAFAVLLLPLQYLLLCAGGADAILVGHALSTVIGAGLAAAFALRMIGPGELAASSATVDRHAAFSLAGIINTVANNAPVQVVAALFGEGAAGIFAIAIRVLGAPLLFLGNAISTALVSEIASGSFRSGRGDRLFAAIGLAFSATLMVVASTDVVAVLAPAWSGVTLFLMLLAPVYGLRLAAIPAVAEINTARDGTFLLGWEIGRLVVLLLLAVAFTTLSMSHWVAALAISWFAAYSALLVRGRALAKRRGQSVPGLLQ